MYFARVGIYRFKSGGHSLAVERARNGLLARLSEAQGFVDYTLVLMPDGRAVSLSLWETRRDAIRAVAGIEHWVRDNIGHFLDKREAFVGEVELWVAEEFSARARTVYATSVVTALYEGLCARNPAAVLALVHSDATLDWRTMGKRVPLRETLLGWMKAFSDLAFEDVQLTVQDDRVFMECKVHVRHTGTLDLPGGPLPATGRVAEGRIGVLFVTAGDRISEMRLYADGWHFLLALGPAPLRHAEASVVR